MSKRSSRVLNIHSIYLARRSHTYAPIIVITVKIKLDKIYTHIAASMDSNFGSSDPLGSRTRPEENIDYKILGNLSGILPSNKHKGRKGGTYSNETRR